MPKQLEFQFAPMYKKAKWNFTCICWHCLRIFEVPAKVFLQGDPVCVCGSENIAANHESRTLMEKLKAWKKAEPFKHGERKVIDWNPKTGATYE